MSNVPTEKKIETPVLRCPKNMKLPKAIKAAASMMNVSKADKNFFMRSMGIALHEQAAKSKSNQRDNRSERKESMIPSSGPTTA